MFDGQRPNKTEVVYHKLGTEASLGLRTDTEKHQPPQQTGSVSVKNRKPRAAEVCLCLLCFLLLTAVIVLCVHFTIERNQLLTHIVNLTEGRKQIKEDENQLNHWLNKQDRDAGKFKWIYYNFRFYYISSESKSWNDSRKDCQEKGADLVMIDTHKENKFLQSAVDDSYFWTGWRSNEREGIDGTALTDGIRNDNSTCAVVTADGYFYQSCNSTNRWICERKFINH